MMLACDTHLHSHRSFVGNQNMTLMGIADQAAVLGVDVVSVTDHLMKPEDIENLKATREDIIRFNEKGCQTRILFGVEVCETDSDGSTLLDQKLVDDMGFEVIIGGVHETHMPAGSSLADMAAVQHRHHLLMMKNPLIEILVHPWWLYKAEFEKLGIHWPENMSFIPEELVVELAVASRQTRTYIEISTMSGLNNKDTSQKFKQDLLEYYRRLHREGALFAIGTDAHEMSEMSTYPSAVSLIKEIGIRADRIWQPKSSI